VWGHHLFKHLQTLLSFALGFNELCCVMNGVNVDQELLTWPSEHEPPDRKVLTCLLVVVLLSDH